MEINHILKCIAKYHCHPYILSTTVLSDYIASSASFLPSIPSHTPSHSPSPPPLSPSIPPFLTGDRLPEEKLEAIATRVVAECDVISDGKLTFSEFEHVVVRSPDFVSLFHITI